MKQEEEEESWMPYVPLGKQVSSWTSSHTFVKYCQCKIMASNIIHAVLQAGAVNHIITLEYSRVAGVLQSMLKTFFNKWSVSSDLIE